MLPATIRTSLNATTKDEDGAGTSPIGTIRNCAVSSLSNIIESDEENEDESIKTGVTEGTSMVMCK